MKEHYQKFSANKKEEIREKWLVQTILPIFIEVIVQSETQPDFIVEFNQMITTDAIEKIKLGF